MAAKRATKFLFWRQKTQAALCLILWWADLSQAQEAQTPNAARPTLTMPQAVERALASNRDILIAREEIKRIKGLEVEVRAEALPQLSLQGNLTYESDELIGQSGLTALFEQQNTFWSGGVRLRQVIYEGGRVAAAMRIARLTEDQVYLDLRRAIENTIFDVRRIFLEILLQRELLHVQDETLALLREELSNQERRFRAGVSTRFNVLRAEVELANAEPERIRVANQLKLSYAALARLLAADYDVMDPMGPPFEVVGSLDTPPVRIDPPTLLANALNNRPEIERVRKQILIENQQLTIDRAGNLPRFDAFVGFDFRSQRFEDDLADNAHGWLVGVQGSWNLFDGFLTRGRIDQARARQRIAQLRLDDTLRSIAIEVREGLFRYEEAQQLLASQKTNVAQAAESLRLARARFEVGAATQLDVLQARVALVTAQTNELRARFDHHLAILALERITSGPLIGSSISYPPSATNHSP